MSILQRGLALLRMRELATGLTSVNRLVKAIQGEKLGYHYQTLWRDASNVFNQIKGEEKQSLLDLSGPIHERDYLSGYWQRDESYKFFGEATWYNPLTGEYETGLFTMYSNVDLPADELAALWSAQKWEYEAQVGLILVSVEWTEKWHRFQAPYRETMEL